MNKYAFFPRLISKKFTMTNSQMMERLKNVSVYKRIMPKLGINFSSKKSQELLKESIESGCADSYFPLADQFQTQADPTFCGPTTMVCVFNSLGVDPRKKWKGIWRWYLEGVIKCLDIEKTKDYGMTLEEFCLIAKCNGVYPDAYRPDPSEQETEKEMLNILTNTNGSMDELNFYCNSHEVIKHDKDNSECKENFQIRIKKANEDFFRTCVYSSTRRENFFLVTNTSRMALKQTGDGHFSPVAAFHPGSGHLLLMDAARFKYNSMWFTIGQIFNAFKNLDKSTQKPRGFILLSRYY
jgi:glutathione gamma-glutamylcysteinyltransferase